MTATDTETALLAAIRENPGDIVLRGAYADCLKESGRMLDGLMQNIIAEPDRDEWRLDYAAELERTAGAEECELCKGKGYYSVRERGEYGPNHYQSDCLACRGSGRVSDGRKEWAAFIRAQCELAANAVPNDATPAQLREAERRMSRETWDALRARERELWPAVQPFFRTMGCETVIDPNHYRSGNGARHPWVVVSRGLPSVVRCTLAEWMGGECGQCQGRGQRTIDGDGSGPWTKCQYCIDGRDPGIGPQLAQAWPLVRVEVTDAVIHPSGGNSTYYVGGLGIFPKEFWRRLEGHRTPSAARAALSDATIAWARGQVIDAIPETARAI
jgi:uncharacterized protein (TIGR02996 family)